MFDWGIGQGALVVIAAAVSWGHRSGAFVWVTALLFFWNLSLATA